MKKFAIPALAAAIALGACAEAEAPADEGTDGTDTVVVEEPAATETTVVTEPGTGEGTGSSVTIDGADVDATISEDGVQANIDAN
ncbi:hypothetical protein K3152_08415 [Qipengyuania sp. 1NDH17]|uniref:Uncharacterized protein n=1 Tax=Qipengyuania polymorpha TaxID=2867234 RepID=A0ABS7IXI2_9SPHN|nr:hypothetical protein [Qipengyuania polymorpha]MBX7458266.1 hypothetical protein [Qipengyuania polymorpha]